MDEGFRRIKLDHMLNHMSVKSSSIPDKEAVVDVAWIPINSVNVNGANLESPVYVIRNPISRLFEEDLWQVYDHLPFSKYNKMFDRRICISSPLATSQDLYFHIGANNAIYTGVPTHPMECAVGKGYGPHNDAGPHTHDGS
eukprot:scaffold17327_cov67-Attheya_sp.AAC.12